MASALGEDVAPLLRDVRRGPERERPAEKRDLLRGRRRGGYLESDRQHEPRLAAVHRRGRPGLQNARRRCGRGVRLRGRAGRLAGRRALRHHQPAAVGRADQSADRAPDAPAELGAVGRADERPDDAADVDADGSAESGALVAPHGPPDVRAHGPPDGRAHGRAHGRADARAVADADDERAVGLAVPDRGADLRDVAADRAADVAADRRADERADGAAVARGLRGRRLEEDEVHRREADQALRGEHAADPRGRLPQRLVPPLLLPRWQRRSRLPPP